MRKSQKLLAFVLAMMMAFSLMSLAAAYDEADGHGYECTECSGDEGHHAGVGGRCAGSSVQLVWRNHSMDPFGL